MWTCSSGSLQRVALCQGRCPLEHCGPAARLCRLWAAAFVPWNLKWERQLCGRCLACPRCQTEQGGCVLGGWEQHRRYSGFTVHAFVRIQYVFTVVKLHYVIKLTVYAFPHSPGHSFLCQKYLNDEILKLTF